MKTILLTFSLLFSLNSLATEVDVINAEFGVLDEAGNPQLCLTVVRIPRSGSIVGIVESLYDCFYARRAKKNPHIDVNLKKLTKVDDELLSHLQSLQGDRKFLFSDGE